MNSNVPREFSVSLPREDVVSTFFGSPVEGMRGCVLGGAEECTYPCKPIIGRK